MFSHLHRSAHVGDFVISSEEAIAKGIRRIVALTGPEATKALKKAALLEQSVTNLKNSTSSTPPKEIQRKITELGDEISASQIPYWKKDDLRNSIKELKKTLDDMDKANKHQQMNQIVEDVKKLLTENTFESGYIVKLLQAQSNTKALDAALKQVKTLSPNTSAIFFSVDETAGKVFCLSNCSGEAIGKGLKANEWVGQAAKVIWCKQFFSSVTNFRIFSNYILLFLTIARSSTEKVEANLSLHKQPERTLAVSTKQ